MEDIVQFKTFEGDNLTEIKIDNSSPFKDFTVSNSVVTLSEESDIKRLFIQIDTQADTLEIDGVKLTGLSLTLFKQFINQI